MGHNGAGGLRRPHAQPELARPHDPAAVGPSASRSAPLTCAERPGHLAVLHQHVRLVAVRCLCVFALATALADLAAQTLSSPRSSRTASRPGSATASADPALGGAGGEHCRRTLSVATARCIAASHVPPHRACSSLRRWHPSLPIASHRDRAGTTPSGAAQERGQTRRAMQARGRSTRDRLKRCEAQRRAEQKERQRRIPESSPTSVLTGPDRALLRRSNGMRRVHGGMAVPGRFGSDGRQPAVRVARSMAVVGATMRWRGWCKRRCRVQIARWLGQGQVDNVRPPRGSGDGTRRDTEASEVG